MQIVTGDKICPNSSFSWRSCCICTPLGFVTKEFRDLHCVDVLKNFAANIFLKLVCKLRTGIRTSNYLVTYWKPCIERRDFYYRIGLIGYWGKGSTVGWYKVLRFFYKWEKQPRQKPHRIILRPPLLRIYYYHNKRLQVKESQYFILTYCWTLTPIPNWTCSVMTISHF